MTCSSFIEQTLLWVGTACNTLLYSKCSIRAESGVRINAPEEGDAYAPAVGELKAGCLGSNLIRDSN